MTSEKRPPARPCAWETALCAVFLLLVFGFAAAFWLVPDRAHSEQENRDLAQFPSSSHWFRRLTDGRLSEEFNAYFCDQFPLRDSFIGLKAVSETVLLRGENNGIVLGRDGYLIARGGDEGEAFLCENLSYLDAFSRAMTAEGIPVYAALCGRSCDVLTSHLPPAYPCDRCEALWETAASEAAEDGYVFLDLMTPLRERDGAGEAVYYRTDHHWTTGGAYRAYCLLGKVMGFSPAPESAFDVQILSDSFYGTARSRGGFPFIAPEPITLWRYEGDEDVVTEILDRNETFSGFYDLSYAAGKDKYGTFLSGNNACVRVRHTDDAERPRLLIVKDSFAHALAPFLAIHYDLDLIDLRYFNGSPAAYAREIGADAVLFLNAIDTFTGSALYRSLLADLDVTG